MVGRLGALTALLLAAAPGDTPRQHVESITSASHTFRLAMGGTLDGPATRSPIGYSAWTQAFEPMRSVRLENVGDTDAVNPRITVNGRHRWRTAREIVEEALSAYGDPAAMGEGEKARAIWEYQRHHRFHATTNDAEVQDPVKMYNVYGYTLCGDEAQVLMDLWRLAGLKVRQGFPTGHCVSEVWYDGAWHLLDSDEHVICLKRDNETIASEEQVVRDHDLVKRTHTYGILTRDDRKTDEFSASLYIHEGKRQGEWPSHVGHTMNFTLRPGEALEWRWGHVGKHHYAGEHLRQGWGEEAWARLCNGKWVYRPPLRRLAARPGVADASNVRWTEKEGEPALARDKPDAPGSVVWKIEAPYVLVGGTMHARTSGDCAFSISFDGKTWKRIEAGRGPDVKVDLDPFLPQKGPARYRYLVRVELPAPPGGLEAITLDHDLQMAPLSLPALELGENVIAYADETQGPRAVRVTFDWVERSGSRPPEAPAHAVFPADGAEVEDTRFSFEWSPATDPHGDAIADYQFQLGDPPNLRWVLSPNFDKLVSMTADRGRAKYTIPYAGLLNPGRRYSWRVRAKDRHGAWGPWSKTWSFIARGPGVPVNLRWERKERPEWILAWDENALGRKAIRYEVYASDEKGFTPSDEPYAIFAGNQKTGGLFPGQERVTRPSNRIATTPEPRLVLQPRHAFTRVIAVDEKGLRSGASDYLTAPRPFITTNPPAKAKDGSEFRYEVKAIHSIGDLRCRTIKEECYNAAFWDAEQPKFSLAEGPAWLKLDPATGALSGTAQAGTHRITVKVEIAGVGTDTQTFSLSCEP